MVPVTGDKLEYLFYFFLTFIISTIFSIGGVGSSVALIPFLNLFGVGFDMAKAAGLFSNTLSTISASILNFKKGLVGIKEVLPFALATTIFAPLGAYSSTFLDTEYVKFGFGIFLFISATLMLKGKPSSHVHTQIKWLMIFGGILVGYISGILGIGGGAIIVPLLIYLGYEAKKVAILVSFIIPFSTLFAFSTYLFLIEIDWLLLGAVAIGSILGGIVGNHLMIYKLSQTQIKRFLAIILYLLGIKIIWAFICG